MHCDDAAADIGGGLLRGGVRLDHEHIDAAHLLAAFPGIRLQVHDVYRFSAAHDEDGGIRIDYGSRGVLPGDEGAGRHGRGGAGGHPLGSAGVAVHHPCGCAAGEADPGDLAMIENGTPKSSKEAPPLRVEAVRKSFGAQKVLNGISLEAAKGETVAVLGKSGTGKSVLLKLMIGLQQPDSGSIRVHGEELRGLRREELNEVRRKMGFLFQNAALYDSLTVEENVVFPLERNSGLPKGNKKKRARELLAAVGMDESLNKLPGEISGGMQKRVGLARALALEPDILLCDEPTAGLDPI